MFAMPSDPSPERPSDMADTPDPNTTPGGASLIDRLCDEFERGWLEHRPPPIEDVVRSVSAYLQPQLFRELLAVEREYRTRDGRPVTVAETRARFAGLGPWVGDIIQEVVANTASWPAGPPDHTSRRGRHPRVNRQVPRRSQTRAAAGWASSSWPTTRTAGGRWRSR